MILNKFVAKTTIKFVSTFIATVVVMGIIVFSNNVNAKASSGNEIDVNEDVMLRLEIASEDSEVETDPTLVGFVYCDEIPMSRELQEFTYRRCEEEGLDYTVVLALIWRESGFNPNAIGYNSNGTKDNGIMQINDVNRNWLKNELGIINLLDPKENIIAGTSMLGSLARDHGQHYALLAYQYGEQGMINKVSVGVTTNHSVEKLYSKSKEFGSIIYGEQEKL